VSAELALLGGAAVGMAAGGLLIPATRRELAAATTRANDGISSPTPKVVLWDRVALIVVSGLIPGIVLYRGGWAIDSIPPLLLFVGLVQLAYCDLKQRLLPRPMVHATTICLAISAVAVAASAHLWHTLVLAALCGAGLTFLFFVINLINPNWIAFGDVRLAPAFGLGLAWVAPMAMVEGFFMANVLAAVFGIAMMLAGKGHRKSALPFGLYLAISTGAVLLLWS